MSVRLKTIFLLPIAFFALASFAFAQDASKVFKKASRSVVVVYVYDDEGKNTSQGSGVVIGKGEVVTNCHVIENGEKITVHTKTGQPKTATLFRADWEKDVCLLNVPGLKSKKAKIRPSNSLKIGESVYAIGSPEGMDYSLSAGLVSQLRRDKKDSPPIIQTDASVSSGSSGGGLFDKKGNLVGIVSFVLEEAQNIGFATPVEWIEEVRVSGIETDSTISSETLIAGFRLLNLILANSLVDS
ncbi:MAG: trypsin-like serine protease [Candidatus Mycalebacterium zealandia]|nr:MAG: trypsin-like serine protease [Candidatus Mycalebacterium zealandia]